MAKSFREIGKKAEELIEQGREADQNIQRCQASVAMANKAVASARRDLEAASSTDEEGNPAGDVEQARARLAVAQNQLAHSQQRLNAARGEANRVRQEKNAHVQEIERHNQTERSNLQKLRQLKANAFSGDSVALTEGIAQRLNEAEDTRVELLRSMGIDATAEHVSVGGEASADLGWSGGGFADLDVAGVLESVHGRGSEGTAQSNGVATPVGGALNAPSYSNDSLAEERNIPFSDENNNTPDNQSDVRQTNEASPLRQIDGRLLFMPLIDEIGYDTDDAMKQVASEMINKIWDNPNLTTEQKCEQSKRTMLMCANELHHNIVQAQADVAKVYTKVKERTPDEKRQSGEHYIDAKLELVRESLIRDYGVVSVSGLDATMSELKRYYSRELEKDINGQPNGLYDNPDYNLLVERINSRRAPIANTIPGANMSFELADSGHVNPNIGKSEGYYINCQSCVVVFEARERGYDVEVLPNTKGSMLERLAYNTNLAWIDPETGKHPEYVYDNLRRTPDEYYDFIDSVVKPGQRYTIEFIHKRGSGGHIVNIDRAKDGQLRIKDNQRRISERSEWIGANAVGEYLGKMRYENFSLLGGSTPCVPKLLRIDNMDFDYSVVNNIMKEAEHGTNRS